MIWKQKLDLSQIAQISKASLSVHLGMEFTEVGPDYLEATMPVDERTRQPFGLLHGGASVALAETLGSVAALLCIENLDEQVPVGVEINANHLNSVRSGKVTGRCTPIKIGRRLHVWQIDIRDERDRPVCVSRITIAIVERR
ncbi:hotdog fold thioesterase [Flavilitoribacter nigricans]|uniref:Phenylacetic acid degradation protein n=1 Tax=Flavilitoribacter nigricans (strain ATCC 23147 / DSM 23189 / NBRC 102662 / NCIMB 1420 / SS-2) TaxID=1122177 RepID=A0A2D0NC24_FLAN2|nr:hotdog fold thioesterase [Flavilitoribacter nigricans]PHN06037.1 phenylacetic acid degradation protein [Flavilitoribacter nigricans DSM 23189 = NBRC 102662]